MKDQIHPDYHEITVIMTDGTKFVTRSTYAQAGASIQLDIDPKTHPAYTGQHRMVDRGGQLAKFNKRFAGITGKPAGEAKAAAAPAEKIKLTTTGKSAADKKKA